MARVPFLVARVIKPQMRLQQLDGYGVPCRLRRRCHFLISKVSSQGDVANTLSNTCILHDLGFGEKDAMCVEQIPVNEHNAYEDVHGNHLKS